MRCSAAQCRAVRCGAVRDGTVRRGAAQWGRDRKKMHENTHAGKNPHERKNAKAAATAPITAVVLARHTAWHGTTRSAHSKQRRRERRWYSYGYGVGYANEVIWAGRQPILSGRGQPLCEHKLQGVCAMRGKALSQCNLHVDRTDNLTASRVATLAGSQLARASGLLRPALFVVF